MSLRNSNKLLAVVVLASIAEAIAFGGFIWTLQGASDVAPASPIPTWKLALTYAQFPGLYAGVSDSVRSIRLADLAYGKRFSSIPFSAEKFISPPD